MIDFAAGHRTAKLATIAIGAEAVVDHGHTGQTNRHAVGIDRIITMLMFFGLAARIERDHGTDVPKLEQAIDRQGIVSAVAAE